MGNFHLMWFFPFFHSCNSLFLVNKKNLCDHIDLVKTYDTGQSLIFLFTSGFRSLGRRHLLHMWVKPSLLLHRTSFYTFWCKPITWSKNKEGRGRQKQALSDGFISASPLMRANPNPVYTALPSLQVNPLLVQDHWCTDAQKGWHLLLQIKKIKLSKNKWLAQEHIGSKCFQVKVKEGLI